MNKFFKSGGKIPVSKEALLSYKELIVRYLGQYGGTYQKLNETGIMVLPIIVDPERKKATRKI